MSNNKTNWWVILAVVIVVAVVVSLITVNLTGNVINVSPTTTAQQVYTKAEVDSLLSSKTTNAGVLSMLDKNCSVWSVAVPNAARQVTGDDICKERGAGTCILMVNYDRFSLNDMIQKCTPYVTGRSDKTVAYCCKP
jgi:hypothetical protein